MGKTNQGFKLFRGDAFSQPFLHVGPFWATQRQVIPIEASDEIEFRLYAESDPSDVKVKLTRGSGIAVETSGFHETNDTIRVDLSTTDTNQTEGMYEFQLEVIYADTTPRVVASGTVEILTRSTADPV